jgi:CRISPR-associated protein Cmr3
MTQYLSISPRDPLIARDGRPFGVGQGQRMRSLSWPYPSVVAGSLRTLLGKQTGGNFDDIMIRDLKALSIAGPLPVLNHVLFFPRPQDCLVDAKRQCHQTRPTELRDGEGSDLPGGLQPVLLPDDVEDFKPAEQPAFWSQAKMVKWLTGKEMGAIPDEGSISDGFLCAPKQDVRFHIRMDPKTGVGRQEDAFFMTAGLDLNRKGDAMPIQLGLHVEANGRFADKLTTMNTLHPLGGERRLAQWGLAKDGEALWKCPPEITNALKGAPKVRMVLATPAIFSGGWKPGWLNQGLEGTVPGANVGLCLKGVTIDRWLPLSGWSLEKGQIGPKPVHRMVPAGGVYFFEVTQGHAQDLADGWLHSVCDDEQNRKDGFGLALWGTWDNQRSGEERSTNP